jgi:hypothetical protein
MPLNSAPVIPDGSRSASPPSTPGLDATASTSHQLGNGLRRFRLVGHTVEVKSISMPPTTWQMLDEMRGSSSRERLASLPYLGRLASVERARPKLATRAVICSASFHAF